MRVWGLNPVVEALRAGRVTRVIVGVRSERTADALALAEQTGIEIVRARPGELDRIAGGGTHQGIAADVKVATTLDIPDLLKAARTPALLVVLDGIEDPQKVGAILRTIDASGADGVIRQTRRAAPLGGAAAKTSAGAVSHVRVAEVVNIARALEELKESGVWTVGLAGDAPAVYDSIDFTLPTALVLGAEGTGLRRLVRERCDWVVSIPMAGHVGSLNVSVAAGVALFEAVRQRRAAGLGEGRNRAGGAPKS